MDMEATLGSEYARVLLDIHDALMTWDLDEGRLLQSVCNILSGSPSIDIAFCALINDADVLRVATAAGDGIPDIAGVVLNPTGLQSPLGKVCATGEPFILERGLLDLGCEDLKVLPWIFLNQPAAIYPMKSRGRGIGLVGVVGNVWQLQEFSMRLLLQRVAQHTGFALDMLRTFVAQVDAAKELRLAASVFDNSLQGIIVSDASGVILKANAAVTRATGYATEELIGETPRIFRSGRHDQTFYSTFWDSIRHTGQWQGEIWNRRKNGEEFPEWLSISTIFDEHKQARYYIGIFVDLSQQKEAESRLAYLAHHDVLTGLPNRALFNDRLMIAIAHARRSQHLLALLFIDLDQFKYINDCYGHAVGDELLRETAHRIARCLRDEDTLSRMGGDEFNVLLQHFGSREEVGSVASRILSALEAPVFVNDCVLSISASVGISVYPEDGDDPAILMNHSDTAMYRAKQDGRGCVRFFQRGMDGYSIARVEMERDIRNALKREEFGLVYQAQFNLESGELVGVEALLGGRGLGPVWLRLGSSSRWLRKQA
jgi:diguanylate cyclase (GGDEF)-like protein/PAS domain S-box-containing protein